MENIIIVYDSKTGLGKRFAEKLPYPSQPVEHSITGPCILVTRNSGLGQIAGTTKKFLKKNGAVVKGVVVNGDKRFGKHFCAAGPKIQKRYGLPLLLNIEGEGTEQDAAQLTALIGEMPG
ncbi:MAG: class Ib ribonucleoside-diphosphate reductase assembly flavoprotein NrdI [Oscillospiraceae bacterium]